MLHRRNFLTLGVCGLIGLPGYYPISWSERGNAKDKTDLSPTKGKSSKSAKAKSVLVIFEQGGLSQMDTWDPKPDAIVEHRSPFRPIQTRVPGMNFTELLKETGSRVANHLTVIRCMTQKVGVGDSHPKGSQYIFSGEVPGGPEVMPDISSVVSYRLGTVAKNLPSNIMVPGTSEQHYNTKIGFLPSQHQVFKTGGQPHLPNWTVPNLNLNGIDPGRFHDRADLLSQLDVQLPGGDHCKESSMVLSLRQQAEEMLTSPATRKAFDLASEPLKIREKYGLGHRGQCYLLGRKLIESGVRFVTLDVREPPSSQYPKGGNMNWDHHDFIYSKNSTEIKGGGPGAGRWGIGTEPMMGSTDRALATLIEDMNDRGLLQDTLICFVTEFGRTPKMNERLGRDHWVHAFSFAFAGAGVPGGQVVGSTDSSGGYITSSKAYTIEDYAATIYEKLGIDRTKPLVTPSGRPIYLSKDGNPIPELA